MKNRIIIFFLLSFLLFGWGGCKSKNETTVSRDTTPPVTTAYPPGGVYYYPITVTLSTNEPATIFYDLGDKIPSVGDPDTLVAHNRVEIYIDHSTSLRFFAVDRAGNVETLKKEEYIIQPPPQSAELNCVFTEPSSTVYINNDKLPFVVRGKAWAKNTVVRIVKISPDGGVTWYKAAGTSHWEFQFNPDKDGKYQFLCKAGNGLNLEMIGTSSVNIIVDNVPPEITPDKDFFISNSMNSPLLISGVADDKSPGELDYVQLSRDKIGWVNAEGTYRWEYPLFFTEPAENKNFTLFLRAIDKAGNVSSVKRVAVEVDNVPPVIDLISPMPWSFVARDSIQLQVNFSKIVTATVLIFDPILGQWEKLLSYNRVTLINSPIFVPEGFDLYNIVVTDEAGNIKNYTLPLLRSGIITSEKLSVYKDQRFYFKPITTINNFWGKEKGNYYVVEGSLYNTPSIGKAFFNYDTTSPILHPHRYISGAGLVKGTISGLVNGGKLYVEVFGTYTLGSDVTSTAFYNLPISFTSYDVIGRSEINYSIKLPVSDLRDGVVVMAYEDTNGDGYYSCNDVIGYYKNVITTSGNYNFNLEFLTPSTPHILINGKNIITTETKPLDISLFPLSTTVVITGVGCGGTVETGLWFDNGNGVLDNGELWLSKIFRDGEKTNGDGDLDELKDGKVVTTLGTIIRNLQFDESRIIAKNKAGMDILYVKNLRKYNYSYTVEVTNVVTGNLIGDSRIGIITNDNGYIFKVKDGIAEVKTLENQNLFPFLVDKNYVLEFPITGNSLIITNGSIVKLGARATNLVVYGRAVDSLGRPLVGGFVLALPPCGSEAGTAQIGAAPIGVDGSFSISLPSERPGFVSPVAWSIHFGLPWTYNFEVTLSPLTITTPTGVSNINLGKIYVGKYREVALNLEDFNGSALLLDRLGSIREIKPPIVSGKYNGIFLTGANKYYIGFSDTELPAYIRDIRVYSVNYKMVPLEGKIISGINSIPSMYIFFYSPVYSTGFYVESVTGGDFAVTLPEGKWEISWNDSLNGINQPFTFNKRLLDTANSLKVNLPYYLPGVLNIAFSFPSSWMGVTKEIIVEEPITKRFYAETVTVSSGYVSFVNMVPGDYVIGVRYNGSKYYYPSGAEGIETAKPVVIDYKNWWRMVQFKIGE